LEPCSTKSHSQTPSARKQFNCSEVSFGAHNHSNVVFGRDKFHSFMNQPCDYRRSMDRSKVEELLFGSSTVEPLIPVWHALDEVLVAHGVERYAKTVSVSYTT